MINTAVFKAYDVRGLYPSEITEELFHQLGRAFVAYLGPGKYAVTRDMRTSSPSLTEAFIAGAVKQGGHIVNYGLVGTDQMYYAVAADGLDGGAQITASHASITLATPRGHTTSSARVTSPRVHGPGVRGSPPPRMCRTLYSNVAALPA